jgi:TetR/AcrR family transcriptional regulator
MSKKSQQKDSNLPVAADLPTRARAAAVRLFSSYGFEGTSVQAIADEIGVTKQALLYHFSSKEGLRTAALEEMVAVWRNVLPRLLSALTHQEAALEHALGELLDFFRVEPAYARFVMQELLRPAEGRNPILSDVEPWLKVAADFIRNAQAEGKIEATVDPEAWMINLGTLILGTLSLIHDRSVPGKPTPKRILREMARIARASLMPMPAQAPGRSSAPEGQP